MPSHAESIIIKTIKKDRNIKISKQGNLENFKIIFF